MTNTAKALLLFLAIGSVARSQDVTSATDRFKENDKRLLKTLQAAVDWGDKARPLAEQEFDQLQKRVKGDQKNRETLIFWMFNPVISSRFGSIRVPWLRDWLAADGDPNSVASASPVLDMAIDALYSVSSLSGILLAEAPVSANQQELLGLYVEGRSLAEHLRNDLSLWVSSRIPSRPASSVGIEAAGSPQPSPSASPGEK